MDVENPNWEEIFKSSWDGIEEFYHRDIFVDPSWEWLRPLLYLISDLRRRGYDKQLRAGQSIYHFILSRSKRHGLVKGQAMIRIIPEEKGMTVFYNGPEGSEKVEFDRVELSEELEKILSKLMQHEIS